MGLQVQSFEFLPSQTDVCPECLTKHAPDSPHDGDSLYYHCTFYTIYSRWPTWADAIAHCNQSYLETPFNKDLAIGKD